MAEASIKAGDIAELEDQMTQLWKGAADGVQETELQRNCEADGGEIVGIGPNCQRDDEIGKLEYALCWYDATIDCMRAYTARWEPACYTLEHMMARGTTCSSCLVTMFEAFVDFYICEKGETESEPGVANECECKQCDIRYFQEPPEEEDPEDDTDPAVIGVATPSGFDNDTDKVDPLKLRTVKTNSAYTVIPRLFGRYVANGNIIWVGNKVTENITYTKTLDGGGTTTVNDTITKVDFIVALCLGPLDSILRIWADDLLIYNATLPLDQNGDVALSEFNNGTNALNVSAMADSEYEMSRLQSFSPTVQLLTGSSAQRVLKNYTTDVGFGRAPAHRGIALVSFKDVDVRLFTNNFPEFKFDVTSEPPQDVLPNVQSAVITGITQDYLEVDQRTGLLNVRDGADVILLNLDTLTESYRATLTNLDKVMALKSGNLLYENTGNVLKIHNPYKDIERQDYGTYPGPAVLGAVSFVAYDAIRVPQDIALIPITTTGAFDIQRFDYNTDTGTFVATVAGLTSYAIQDAVLTGDDGVLYYFQFLLPTGTQNDLKIRKYTMTTAGVRLDDTPTLNTITLSNSIWGGATTGVVLDKVIRDPIDNGFILFFNTGYIVKLSFAGAVQWTTQTAFNWTGFTTVGEARSGLAHGFYYFVATTGEVLRLNVTTGTVEEIDDLAARAIPLPTGAQYYDAKTQSVVYISEDDTVIRIFPGRVIPERVPISRIIDALVAESRLDSSLIDTSGADSVTIDGYYIDQKTTVRDTITALGSLYQITVEDNGERLVVRKEADVGSVTVIDYDDIIRDTLHIEHTINEDILDSLAARFVNIDDRGLIEIVETISLKPDQETAQPSTAEIVLNLNDTPANVRAYLEQALRLRVASRRTLSAQLLPKHIGFTPRDRIQYAGDVYRIRNHLMGIGEESVVQAEWFDPNVVEEPVTIASTSSYVNQYTTTPQTRKPYRPIVLFMNAVNDEDQSRCGVNSGTQIAYAGIDAPDRLVSPALSFGVRMFGTPTPVTPNIVDIEQYFDLTNNSRITMTTPETISPSPNYYTPEINEGVHIGRLVTAPNDLTWQFKTDTTSTLVIKFDHADTVSKFVSYANKYDVLENPRSNLLIVGREYIQFHAWSVAGDGLTVTFTTLFRGKFGTEPYMGTHVVGEHCFLYTPETFKPLAINPMFTKRQQTANIFLRGPLAAGVPKITWGKRSDAGSARPYGPNPFGRLTREEDIFYGRRRRSVQIDPMQGGGTMPSEWVPNQQAGYIFIETGLAAKPTIEEFEAAYVRAQSALDIGILFQDTANWGSGFEDINDRWLLLVEVVDDIFGHPTIWRVPGSSGSEGSGGGPCDPSGAYDVGYPDGCIDGLADFGGTYQGPNYNLNRGLSADPLCYPSAPLYTSEYDLGYDAGYTDGFFSGVC